MSYRVPREVVQEGENRPRPVYEWTTNRQSPKTKTSERCDVMSCHVMSSGQDSATRAQLASPIRKNGSRGGGVALTGEAACLFCRCVGTTVYNGRELAVFSATPPHVPGPN